VVRLRLGLESRVVSLLGLCELLEEGLRRVIFERERRLADGDGGGLLTHLFSLEISFESIEEKTVMRDTVPVKDLLLLLSSNTVVLVQEVEEGTLWLFERCICARLEVPQVGEDALFEFLRVLHWSAESLEAKGKATNDVGASDVKEIVPNWVVSLWDSRRTAVGWWRTIIYTKHIHQSGAKSDEYIGPAPSLLELI